MSTTLATKISDARTYDVNTHGRDYALNAARFAITQSRMFRIMGMASQADHYAQQAAGYRREAVRSTEYYALTGRHLSDTSIDGVATTWRPIEWRDHTSPSSREREVRVERARQAYRATLSGRIV